MKNNAVVTCPCGKAVLDFLWIVTFEGEEVCVQNFKLCKFCLSVIEQYKYAIGIWNMTL